ncbi:hypothetical protein Tsubulata_039785 [Turnera subulata]|uniref:Uncharacterized protein n=1 Tax=Turnera subulata TaxID=218843 RepID=A0A9Q0FS33_9ROSI|nr:hypothetical protein Tsubulata_039785 [Turnera subulata]
MKVSGIWVMYMVVGTALMFLDLSPASTCMPTAVAATSRKLKENGNNPSSADMNLEDYRPIDPVPSSKASIKPGPIQHGTPLNPFIPKPAPPSPVHPGSGGLP